MTTQPTEKDRLRWLRAAIDRALLDMRLCNYPSVVHNLRKALQSDEAYSDSGSSVLQDLTFKETSEESYKYVKGGPLPDCAGLGMKPITGDQFWPVTCSECGITAPKMIQLDLPGGMETLVLCKLCLFTAIRMVNRED